MKRFSIARGMDARNRRVDDFLREVIEVCKKHGISISHEDAHGAFIVEPYTDDLVKWLWRAHDGTPVENQR